MKLSIVTICRNAGAGLRNTVNAVLSQSRLPDEYLIQDGDSSDQSVEALVAWLWENAERLKAEILKGERRGADRRPGKETQDGRRKTEDHRLDNDDREQRARRATGCRIGSKEQSDWQLGELCEWGEEPQNTQKDTELGIRLGEMNCAMRIRSEPDAGIYDALNRGVACAQGDVIGLLHAGDVYARQDVLANVMRAFEGGADAVYGDLQYVRAAPDGGLRVVRHWKSGSYARAKLRWGWMPPHPALFLRREVYERAALSAGVYFDAAFRCAGDYDFILRVLPSLQVPPVYLREVLVQMRTGGISNRSLQHILVKSREDWLAIRRNHAGGLHTLIGKNLQKVGQFHASS